MPSKIYEVDGIGPITLVKNRRSRHLRLSITAKNEVRVSLPTYLPYTAGLKFALSKKSWIIEHLAKRPSAIYEDGARIGKSFRIKIDRLAAKTGVKIKGHEIIISGNPANLRNQIDKSCEKALRQDAEKLLPIRLNDLARKHSYAYKDLRIRKLTSRWGSCSSEKRITLSSLLIQLPWDLIDYVILHELNHTVHMNHGPGFWADMEKLVPGARAKRKALKEYKSAIIPLAA